MEVKPLYNPKSKKWPGLRVYCLECGTLVYDLCKKTGKPISQCPNPERHRYKLIEYVPGTKSQRVTRLLETRDRDEAVKEEIAFRKEVKSGEYKKLKKKFKEKEEKKIDESPPKPFLLIEAFARYLAWMSGENVPIHLRRNRDPETIKDVERELRFWAKCLKDNRDDLKTTTIDDINDNMVGLVYQALENKGFSGRTFNKYMNTFSSFMRWYSQEYDIPIRNYFERVKRKNLNPNPQAISNQEFLRLLEKTRPEYGIKEYHSGKKPARNMFRDWLTDGFKLGVLTGRRREELANMRWNDIKEDEGVPLYIRVSDLKVNRIQGRSATDEMKYVYVPITASLKALLDDLGYEKNAGSPNYILAPEVKISRKRVMSDILSRGFSHFYNLLDTGKNLTFKSLRKAYITQLELFLGRGNARFITGHSGNQILERNYIDPKEIAKGIQDFEVFPTESSRDQDLQKIRIKNENKVKDREI
jgi:integrase